jgi:Uma2 family endonuclease
MSRPRVTLADFLSIPEGERFHEVIDGELVQKALPGPKHAHAQTKLGGVLDPFHRRAGGPPERPGGWWFLTEAEVLFGAEPLRPDVAGWRRDRLLELPEETIIDIVPDWICEVLSPRNAANDTVKKKRIYHHSKVAHYWILDPKAETLIVYRWHEAGFLEVLAAERNDRVRPEPFEAIEIAVGVFFGDD